MNLLFIFVSLLGFVYSSYQEGEFVSESDQNITMTTCYAGNDYAVDDIWKLSDWNGALNGGHYNIVYIEMAASW
tara:strand:- start:1081 stop:1302 length:222 start_codon:yes stop_codon:yes gene_type:complete